MAVAGADGVSSLFCDGFPADFGRELSEDWEDEAVVGCIVASGADDFLLAAGTHLWS